MTQQESNNSNLKQQINELLEFIRDLRLELRVAETDIEDNCVKQIVTNFLRIMITRANSKLRNLRQRQQD